MTLEAIQAFLSSLSGAASSLVTYDEDANTITIVNGSETETISLGGDAPELDCGAVADCLTGLVAAYPGLDPNGDAPYSAGSPIILVGPSGFWAYDGTSYVLLSAFSTDSGSDFTCADVQACIAADLALGEGTPGVVGFPALVGAPDYCVSDIVMADGTTVYAISNIGGATIADLVANLNAEFTAQGYALTASDNAGVLNLTSGVGTVQSIVNCATSPATLVPGDEVAAAGAGSVLCPLIVQCVAQALQNPSGPLILQIVQSINNGGAATTITNTAPTDLGTQADEAAAVAAAGRDGFFCWTDADGCSHVGIIKGGAWFEFKRDFDGVITPTVIWTMQSVAPFPDSGVDYIQTIDLNSISPKPCGARFAKLTPRSTGGPSASAQRISSFTDVEGSKGDRVRDHHNAQEYIDGGYNTGIIDVSDSTIVTIFHRFTYGDPANTVADFSFVYFDGWL